MSHPAERLNVADDKAANNHTVLVYLLLLLHPLYGITALIGIIICHTKKTITATTVFESHRRWQIWTFWTGAIGYVAGFYLLMRTGSWTFLLLTMSWVYYRILFGWWKARNHAAVGRVSWHAN